jgi:hypothetical protein
MWTDVRQLVLNDGPVTEYVDKQLAATAEEYGMEIPEDARETLVAQLIAVRLAMIVSECEGEFHGAPLHIILGAWAGHCLPQNFMQGWGQS